MKIYLLNLFYPNLKQHESAVRNMRAEVEAIAGKNWRVLSAGEQICAMAFATELTAETLRRRFRGAGSETFQFLLAEVSAVPFAYLGESARTWLAGHLPTD